MGDIIISNLQRDGERREFRDHGHALIGAAGGASFNRAVFEPGWRWSEDVKPLAGTDSCQVRHHGYCVSGTMRIGAEDGSEHDIGPGDVFDIYPGHDAWVTSDEPCVMLDSSPAATRYATAVAPNRDEAVEVVRRGYEAFNHTDVETLLGIFSKDAVQHVPGSSPLAGTYKGPEAILGYYGQLAEMTDGTFRAHPLDLHSDEHGHVLAYHQLSGVKNGESYVTRGSILFTLVGDKVTDLLELRRDMAADDAFFS